jgi:hypothetical protein
LANANLPVGFFESLRYSADDVFLDLTAALGATTPLNQNQQNVANAINSFFNAGGTLPPGFLSLFNLTDGNLTNALTQIEGQPTTIAQIALEMTTSFLKLMNPIDSAWGSGFGGGAMTNGNAAVGSTNVTTDTYGFAAGMMSAFRCKAGHLQLVHTAS